MLDLKLAFTAVVTAIVITLVVVSSTPPDRGSSSASRHARNARVLVASFVIVYSALWFLSSPTSPPGGALDNIQLGEPEF